MNDTASSTKPILVVDDEKSIRQLLPMMLEKQGHDVDVAESGEDAVEFLEQGNRYSAVLTDLKMPDMGGLEMIDEVKGFDPTCQVIVMTAHASPKTAKEAIMRGAYDYIEKPFEREQVLMVTKRAVEKHELKSENLYLKERLEDRTKMGALVGQSDAMLEVYDLIERVAPMDTTILIQGESGTGKELVARAIHQESERSEGPFVPVNCGAIPENLIESELFGHKKGAFTDAKSDKIGLFESAAGGTAFLDEIGELSENVQVKLLRVLQEEQIKPVGGTETRDMECRILAATNRDLREAVEEGEFREDLFYRLNIIPVHMPPLRNRPGDVELLIEHFLEQFNAKHDTDIQGIDSDALKMLIEYPYPGNVRELENIVKRAATLTREDMITVEVLPYHIQEESFSSVAEDIELPDEGFDLEGMVERLERNLIEKAMERTDGVKKEAAELLGVSFRSLRYRMDKYDMD